MRKRSKTLILRIISTDRFFDSCVVLSFILTVLFVFHSPKTIKAKMGQRSQA